MKIIQLEFVVNEIDNTFIQYLFGKRDNNKVTEFFINSTTKDVPLLPTKCHSEEYSPCFDIRYK